jgi:hypothetical protein
VLHSFFSSRFSACYRTLMPPIGGAICYASSEFSMPQSLSLAYLFFFFSAVG